MGPNTFKAFGAFAVVAWLGLHAATAQLAVVNGGFEGFEALPSASGQLDRVEDWTNGGSPLAIPDYYMKTVLVGETFHKPQWPK